MPFKAITEIGMGMKTALFRYFGDRQGGGYQQGFRGRQPDLQQILVGSGMLGLPKNFKEIRNTDAAIICNLSDRQRFAVMLFHVSDSPAAHRIAQMLCCGSGIGETDFPDLTKEEDQHRCGGNITVRFKTKSHIADILESICKNFIVCAGMKAADGMYQFPECIVRGREVKIQGGKMKSALPLIARLRDKKTTFFDRIAVPVQMSNTAILGK